MDKYPTDTGREVAVEDDGDFTITWPMTAPAPDGSDED